MPRTTQTTRPWKLAVLISGGGRTLQNLILAIAAGELDAEIVCVVSSVAGVAGLSIAEDVGIATHVLTRKDAPDVDEYSNKMYEIIEPYEPDLVIMAGFLKLLLVKEGWENRILNIHPALLPEAFDYAAGKGMYGDRVHAAVLENEDQESGATVHVVTNEFDRGQPLGQMRVDVMPGDSVEMLAARVFAVECELYPQVIRKYMLENPHLMRSSAQVKE